MADPLSFHELVRQTPGLDEQKPEGLEKARVEVEKRIGGIGQERPEGAVIIDRRLAALRAIGAGQHRAAVLAVGQGGRAFRLRTNHFRPG